MTEKKPADGMRIIELKASNLKRLEAVAIKPDGSIVEITGRNGQGKTSVLDAIWWALAGVAAIQAKPIRKGCESAVIELDLGALKITRRFTAQEDGGYTTSLKVENAEGAAYKSPQSMLDALVGELSFDPLAFSKMKPAEQFAACRRFVPDVDFDAIAAANKDDYALRTAVNRQAKDYRTQADGITLTTLSEGARDETALIARMKEAYEHNADIERRAGNREKASADAERMERQAVEQKLRASNLREDAAKIIAQAEDLEASSAKAIADAAEIKAKLIEAGPLPAPIETPEIETAIAEARAHNAKVSEALAAQKRKAELIKQADAADAKSKELSAAMEARDKGLRAAVAKAKMPVAGLSFGDNCVLLDDLPFDQASDAQQLSASLAIATALNPKLRVIRVRDGGRLDKEAMGLLAKFADANDLQVWVETVESGRASAVVIEDGRVAGAEADKAATDKTEAA